MDYRIRHALRIATVAAWTIAAVAAGISMVAGADAELLHIVTLTGVLCVITATWAGTEVILAGVERILAAMPTPEEVVAETMLRTDLASRQEAENAAGVPRISDFRR